MSLALGCVLAYLLGGVPFGLVIVRVWKGVDIRTIGSGNVGATNASRAFPRARLPVFGLIYVLDFLKGFAPAFWGPGWLGQPFLPAAILLGTAAVIGHCASPFLKLRGGKGVATTTGVIAAVDPVAFAVAIGVFFVALGLTRKVFVGSLALGVALPVAVIAQDPDAAFGPRLSVTLFAFVIAAFLFYTHRSNLRGLRPAAGGTS